ncbi:Origin recognition complex subunit 2 [Coemansia spiralis]|uniref:Origin recognition complex subunit 2 n=2 Tax=Coemansia TaxID=4863 RepID=A0A9W8G9I6_9FUNG|nr:origin recognition complex subunit 2-domain-containing protein [Coemansia spiralis]KAJ1996246.1 Origin recognition complex subunit 2 [Coemansia umbellata]KAJ2625998.1 Origin recognition complex subunit 2 [Coemansia sp. RSA 1358]KAJ2678647.1 Origin recognition complex subunit 2 [Coemansia spiralis]
MDSSGQDKTKTPRSALKVRSRVVDMGLTLTATKQGRKLHLIDNAHSTPTRGISEITDILKLGAAVDAEDKENSSEEATGLRSVVGKDVYGFQKRVQRGRGRGGSVRGRRGRGAHSGRGRASSSTNKRARTDKSNKDSQMFDENDDEEEEEEEDEEAENSYTQTRNTGHASAGDSEDGEENSALLHGMEGTNADDDNDDGFSHNGPAYERYFQDLHSSKKSKTSDNTLSKLPPLSQSEFRAILAKVPAKHKGEMQLLDKLHRQQFKQWRFELDCGFNLVFYGYGSKRRLLNSFATQLAVEEPVVIINGYFPTLNLKHSLEKIVIQVMQLSDTTGSVADLASLIHGYFSSSSRSVDSMTLVVHNIDGPCLRKHQTSLSVLSSCKSIRILASVDHIEAPLIWDSSTVTRFNWAWHDLTTFEPYTAETSYENFSGDTAEVGPRGVLHVLASLTENAKSIFRILAEYQIAESIMDDASDTQKNGADSKQPEMPYNNYFAACRDQFLVSSEMTFRSQLTEFRDHKVIQSRHAPDGTEFVHIPLDGTTLGTILESMD